jgi:DNA-binding response OmpR family regulator
VLSHGAFDYIRKPVRKEVLLLRVANALRAGGLAALGPGNT